MNELKDEVYKIIGQTESEKLEYKSVLPPPMTIAREISSFANTEGGYLILGVSESEIGNIEVNGLEDNVRAIEITEKSFQLLSMTPKVKYGFVQYQDKNLFVIKVFKSDIEILFENKIFKRVNSNVEQLNVLAKKLDNDFNKEIKIAFKKLEKSKKFATNAKKQVFEHYQSILNIIEASKGILYPVDFNHKTESSEGKILLRLLFSSIADNFETYLANLLYEIYLACPNALKSNGEVTVQEVLECSDMDEFINFIAQKKVNKLSKGSLDTFIKDNKHIKIFDIIDNSEKDKVKKILQIRHLFTHKNGIIDKKFLKYIDGDLEENTEFLISVKELCSKTEYLSNLMNKLDKEAINVYKLSSND